VTRDGDAGRLRVMLVTRNFPPQVGGMERFNERILAQLAQRCDVALCGPRGAEAHVPANIAVRTVSMGSLPVFVLQAAWRSLRLARQFSPDLVIAGSGLTAPMARLAARMLGVPMAVFVYGLDLVVKNAIYQRLWMPSVRASNGVIAISQYTRDLAIACGVSADKIEIVTPGVDPVEPQPDAAVGFRQQHGLGGRPLLIAVGRLTRRKGLVEFIERCLPSVVAQKPDAVLVCVGGDPVSSLAASRGGVGEAALTRAAELGLGENVRMLGSLSNEELIAAYQASDVHVFPVLDLPGDAEGFGIVALEAAANGIPTVAFAVGGVPDAIAPGKSGALIDAGDYAAMARAIIEIISDPAADESRRQACIAHANEFAWNRIGEKLQNVVARFAKKI
jgi:phosphatidylinositol alpha-1,6-mannosyltransferase